MKKIIVTAMALAAGAAQAGLSGDVVKVGILTDMSGLYAEYGGSASSIAAQLAIEDVGGTINGKPIQVIVADHKNNAQVAQQIAGNWLDNEKVDVFAEVLSSPIALAVEEIARGKNAVLLYNGVVSSVLTGAKCSATGINWMYDSHAYAGAAKPIVKAGAKNWFMLSVDNVFGNSMDTQVSEIVQNNGGKVLGRAKHMLNAADLNSQVEQARSANAQVIAVNNAGEDTFKAIKAIADNKAIDRNKVSVAAFGIGITDVHKLGLATAQGLQFTSAFYWDYDAQTRAFAKRFQEKAGRPPTEIHAGVYSSLLHYLRAVQSIDSDAAAAVVKRMREMPISDAVVRNATLRADGRMVHDMYLVQVKKPGESKGAWDYYTVKSVIPGKDAFQPLEKSDCPLVKAK